MFRLASACWLALVYASMAFGQVTWLAACAITNPVNGHIHPAVCISKQGAIVVIYGQVNHHDLRITRSTDGGKTWSRPTPFAHTIGKTYYPGSLTTLANGQLLHAWNRWSSETNEMEPRSVLCCFVEHDEGERLGVNPRDCRAIRRR